MAKASLTRLAMLYGCDKYYLHSYLPVYEELLGPRDVKKLLEIGIGHQALMAPLVPFYIHGASLRMWSDYWPKAEIWGCDIRQETLFNEGNIRTFVCDQRSPVSLFTLMQVAGPNFDVMIDDGCHDPDVQISTAQELLPFIVDGGLYIIEDVREPDRVAEAIGGKAYKLGRIPDDHLVVVER